MLASVKHEFGRFGKSVPLITPFFFTLQKVFRKDLDSPSPTKIKMQVNYPVVFINDPGRVYNVARFPASSKSSSTTTLFEKPNIVLEEVNVGDDGKELEEKIEKKGDDSSDEEMSGTGGNGEGVAGEKRSFQSKSAFNKKTGKHLMRRARERKFSLRDGLNVEKFSGIVEGGISKDGETFIMWFHTKHQKFYMMPAEKAYKFTKSMGGGQSVKYDEAMEKLGTASNLDQRYERFRNIGRGGGGGGGGRGRNGGGNEGEEDTSSDAMNAAKSLFATRYGLSQSGKNVRAKFSGALERGGVIEKGDGGDELVEDDNDVEGECCVVFGWLLIDCFFFLLLK